MPDDKTDRVFESSKTAWGQFEDKFAFCFRGLREGDGIAEWKRFVDSCDIMVLLPCLDTIVETWKHEWGIPKGPTVRKVYKDALDKRNATSPSQDYQCRKCHNSGAVWLVFMILRHGEGLTCGGGSTILKKINGLRCEVVHPSVSGHPFPDRLKAAPVPCVCGNGKKYGSRKDGENIVPDCDYWEWSHKGQLEAWDWIDRK